MINKFALLIQKFILVVINLAQHDMHTKHLYQMAKTEPAMQAP